MSQIRFISEAIIERLEQDRFVPARKAQPGRMVLGDRRDVLSPLAVTKRCIRYDPNVFHHRKPLIMEMIRRLNDPDCKILLLGGPQGCGKTSLIRGIIEIMGGGNEQLLWFDVNRHTDFEEIIQFLIQYITYICAAVGEKEGLPAEQAAEAGVISSALPAEPVRRLETLIRRVSHMPLLIVLDNIEYIVDPELRFNSYPFKEMLNFLLAFPNIKMVLCGERLPYADMSPNQGGVADIKVAGLSQEDVLHFMQSRKHHTSEPDPAVLEQAATPEGEIDALRRLYAKTHGFPWLLKTLFYLNLQSRLDFSMLNRMLESEAGGDKAGNVLPVAALVRFIAERLPDQQRKVFQTLCFVRHPLNVRALKALVGVCYPVLGPSGLTEATLTDMLEHALFKPMLKVSYPPQEVLAHIRHRREHHEKGEGKFKPWFELYLSVKRAIYLAMPADERERIHAVLQDFYMREKQMESVLRLSNLKNRALLAEARYHGSASRGRRLSAGQPGSQTVPVEGHASHHAPADSILGKAAPGNYLYRPMQAVSPEEAASDAELDPSAQPAIIEVVHTSGDFPAAPYDPEAEQRFEAYLKELDLSEEEKRLLGKEPGAPKRETPDPETTSPELSAPPPQKITANNTPKTPPDPHSLPEGLMRGDYQADERERAIEKRLAEAVAERNKPRMTCELLALAQYRAGHGHYESAALCLEKALSLEAKVGKDVMAEIYRLSGMVNKATYHHNAALSSLDKAATLIKRLMYEDDTVDRAWLDRLGEVYQNLGEIHEYRKQYDQAIDALTQALRWYHSADDDTREAEVFFHLGTVHDDRGDVENAMHFYQQALNLDESHGNKLSAAAALANMGNLHAQAGRYEEALAAYQRSLSYDRESNNLEGQLNTLDWVVQLYMGRKYWIKAEQVSRQALSLALHEGRALWKASFYMKLGQLAEIREDWQQALSHFEAARTYGEQELSRDSLRWIEQKIGDARAAQSA